MFFSIKCTSLDVVLMSHCKNCDNSDRKDSFWGNDPNLHCPILVKNEFTTTSYIYTLN